MIPSVKPPASANPHTGAHAHTCLLTSPMGHDFLKVSPRVASSISPPKFMATPPSTCSDPRPQDHSHLCFPHSSLASPVNPAYVQYFQTLNHVTMLAASIQPEPAPTPHPMPLPCVCHCSTKRGVSLLCSEPPRVAHSLKDKALPCRMAASPHGPTATPDLARTLLLSSLLASPRPPPPASAPATQHQQVLTSLPCPLMKSPTCLSSPLHPASQVQDSVPLSLSHEHVGKPAPSTREHHST